MNVVYPITTLLSLICFLFNINLWTGIGLHMNGDGLFKSINTPVHQLNYNAIPQEFIGRIRTLSDGVFYSTGLTLVGVLLLFAHAYLNLTQITWIAISLGIVFLLLRVPMGKFYGAGLESMLRQQTIDFSQLPQGSELPQEQSIALVRDWLASGDLQKQHQALEMAHDLKCAHQVWDEILRVPAQADERTREKILAAFLNADDSVLELKLLHLLSSDWGRHQSLALEALIALDYPLPSESLEAFTHHESSEIRTLTAIALLDREQNATLYTWAKHHFENPFCEAGGNALLRILPYRPDSHCGEVILHRLGNSRLFAQQALQVLAESSIQQNSQSWRLVLPYLNDPEPRLRKAAFQFMGQHHPHKAFEFYAAGFVDDDAQVRESVAASIARFPELALPFLREQLEQPHEMAQYTAIASLGQIRTKQAQDLLYRHLQPDFKHLKSTQKWQKLIPKTHRYWQPLALTIFDYQDRLIKKIMFVLANLGYESTVHAVNQALLNREGRERANAIELLSSFKERRFTRPLLSVLESHHEPSLEIVSPDETRDTLARNGSLSLKKNLINLLEESLNDQDPWIQKGAMATLVNLEQAFDNEEENHRLHSLLNERRPLIAKQGNPMSQILLLKKIPIFQNLTLDELELISAEMEPLQVLAQQLIYEEGSWGQFFYVIAQGHITLTKEIAKESYVLKQIGAGDYFGEVSLFDDAPHWDGAIAAEDCTLLKLEKQKFKALMMRHPRISLEICRYLSQRLREYDDFCHLNGPSA